MATLTYLGHSAFSIVEGEFAVLIDPFLTGNPRASASADDVAATHIVVTHGHADHMGDTGAIAGRTGATVHASWEVCEFLGERHGLERLEPGNPGGRVSTPFGWVAFTPAIHSSSFEGRQMGVAMGAVIHIGGRTVYHAGDTALFGDMALIGELYQPDVAIVPVGDRFTMGPEHASRAAELVAAPVAVPCHYATFGLLASDISGFRPRGVTVRALEPGASMGL